jgi:lysylphosphatidylglycerol synthetase-like protein (DUF2156 family)
MNRKDLLGGALFITFSAFFGLTALATLPLGTPEDMGPGFFPVCLAVVLALLGLAVLSRGLRGPRDSIGAVPWKTIAIVLMAPLVFGLVAMSLGLVIATALTVAISLFAGQRQRPLTAVAIVCGITLFSVLVFHNGLKLPIPLFPV